MSFFYKDSASSLLFRPPSRNKSNTYGFLIKLVALLFFPLGMGGSLAFAEVAPGTKTADSCSTNGWHERILNCDGSINPTEYQYVAQNYDSADIIDYRFGPGYSYYHPESTTIPTIGQATTDGFVGSCEGVSDNSAKADDWFAMSGQVLFLPNQDAPTEYKPGVARARNGSIYMFKDRTPQYCFDMRLSWTPDSANYYNTIPDVPVKQQPWIDASNGVIPSPPIAVVRSKSSSSVTGFLLFKNGLIGATGTGNDGYVGCCSNPIPYPFVKLPAGKVPTAGAVTLSQEFLLVTVWDVKKMKGQIAVIANKGALVTSNNEQFMWGLPSWPVVKQMKILGYINLPIKAPSAIAVSNDEENGSGRGNGDNRGLDLNLQSERDTWYNWSGSWFKRSSKSGYAVVLSRAENKAVFIDLKPLLQYYRSMYFTSQANYDLTKNEGAACNEWPFEFDCATVQKPTVNSTINIPQPTAVVAGTPWMTFFWRQPNIFPENIYIATMNGKLRMYKAGNLMTPNSGGTVSSTPFNVVSVGKNVSSIDYGRGMEYGNDIVLLSRGDKAIIHVLQDGTVKGVYPDARLVDPVSITASANRRWDNGSVIFSVMDFGGNQIANYRYNPDWPQTFDNTPVGTSDSPIELDYLLSLPGKPFMGSMAEVP